MKPSPPTDTRFTDLNALGTTIADLPALKALATALRPGYQTIAPAPAAARPVLVAALVGYRSAPTLYLTISAESAQRAAEDLRQWLHPNQVWLFPAADALPYEHMSPGVDVIGRRLAVLRALQAGSLSGVIVTSVKALMQPTLPPADLMAATISLRRGAQIPIDQVARSLLTNGYQRVAMVEAPGELSQRGAILDVWSPGDELPLRIEWFDDEIDSLRRFDPATQRSEQRLEQAEIGPPHEIPLWRHDEALRQIDALDMSNLRREVQEEWQAARAQLADGQRFEGRAFYAPFFFSRVATLLDYLPAGSLVALAEAHLLAQHAAEIDVQAADYRAQLVALGELPADFPRPYLRWDELGLQETSRLIVADFSHNEYPDALSPPLFGVPPLYGGQLRRLIETIVDQLCAGELVVAVTTQAARLQELVGERLGDEIPIGRFVPIHGGLEAGFTLPDLRLTLLTDSEIFGIRRRLPLGERRRKATVVDRNAFLRSLKPGDYVVHIEHGIAVFDGMIRRTVGEVEREYLVLRYAGEDKIYVPVDQIDRVTRYIGAGDDPPTLTRLGTQDWERTKRKVRAAVQELAEELLRLYAQRQLKSGYAFAPDNEWQRELEASFPYLETEDQLRAIAEVKADMEKPIPMDRLVCGDVGFGKTEVALRAAFKAVQDGKQVAILVPTTVLAQQHFDTFRKRMAAFPVTVEMLSRFRSPKEQEAILRDLARGKIDIIIGTHRLLSNDVVFRDLGLVIVDEEQRFGVRHKERLKMLRTEVDVLTLTATPIPRTLHMALAGIRDLSVIDTPPEDRIPIKTYVVPADDHLIQEVIRRELEREGQVYVVHNRVQSIYHVAERLRRLVPEARIAVGHGQLPERDLERVMMDFFEGRYDVLVCTTIIESGLDVPNANTIIIDNATNYGLSQLYQLRGRVGRGATRAYAYLLYNPDRFMTSDARQRLEAIQEATELGAGFRIAMRDLEIRGAGNLLGSEQSGHIAAVGFDLYSRLLEQAVRKLKREVDEATAEQTPTPTAAEVTENLRAPAVSEKVLVAPLVTIDLPLTAYLPPTYIADERVRLAVYQRMVDATTIDEVRGLRQELIDRFGGPLPEPVLHLIFWLQIRLFALQAGVVSITTEGDVFLIRMATMLTPALRERLRRRFPRDKALTFGQQSVRLDRRLVGAQWPERLLAVVEALAL
ncbi:transcription-repair coupling factor [Chloroflexus sp.]|uniref:transcription-repair coupling factor n=1 Tax=Chloroflexus sp. TaxID=1904827 RepID=UPI002628AC78|nr:transcription-repair coupling factor [uncultured Chloroflexus sp.]